MAVLSALDEDKLEDVHTWIASIPLSRPVRNISRDLADAVLVAEIVSHYLPRYVSLNNFTHVNSAALKRYNWETLQKIVLKYLQLNLTPEQVREIVDAKPGVMESFLYSLKGKIDMAVAERRFRPSKKRGSSSTRGSNLSLNQSDSEHERVHEPHHMRIPSTPESTFNKDKANNTEQVQKLLSQVQYLERVIDQKDEHIAALTKKLETINNQNGLKSRQDKEYNNREDQNQILLSQIHYLENVVQQKEEGIITLSKQVERLMEMLYGEAEHGRASANSANASGLTSPVSTASKPPSISHCEDR